MSRSDEELAMEALIDEVVEQQLARVRAVTPPAMVDEMRRLLRLALHADPRTQALLKVLVARPVKESGKRDVRMFREEAERGEEPDAVRAVPAPIPSSRRGRR